MNERTVSYTRMKDGTKDDFLLLRRHEIAVHQRLPERLLAALGRLDAEDSIHGMQVSRLEHSLQTATRAERDGADLEMVVAALLHDIGDDLATANHAQFAASIIRPYVRPEVTWVVNMHGLFQMQFYAHHLGEDATGHLAWRGHRWYDSCQHFCEAWDQESFDPAYRWLPIEHFAPMVREVFSRHPFDPAVVGDDAARA